MACHKPFRSAIIHKHGRGVTSIDEECGCRTRCDRTEGDHLKPRDRKYPCLGCLSASLRGDLRLAPGSFLTCHQPVAAIIEPFRCVPAIDPSLGASP